MEYSEINCDHSCFKSGLSPKSLGLFRPVWPVRNLHSELGPRPRRTCRSGGSSHCPLQVTGTGRTAICPGRRRSSHCVCCRVTAPARQAPAQSLSQLEGTEPVSTSKGQLPALRPLGLF